MPTAIIIIALFWKIWHIPLWTAQGIVGISSLPLLLSTTMAAIVFTWVYNSTCGSLLSVRAFHAVSTITQYLMGPSPTPTDNILSWIVVLLVVIVTGPAIFLRNAYLRMEEAPAYNNGVEQKNKVQ